MRDKRAVDELSIEELERILAVRKREARQERLQRLQAQGRRVAPLAAPLDAPPELPAPPPQQHEAAEDLSPPEPPVTYDLTDDVPRFEDELEEERAPARRPPPAPEPATGAPARHVSRRRAAWDKPLLLIEVAAVIGVLTVLVVGAYQLIIEQDRIEALEQKSAEVQREADAMRATPTPLPELSVRLADYVLPGGHYSPEVTGGEGAFNLDELPSSIRPVAMAQLVAPQAERFAPQASSPVRIAIETAQVQVDASIYGGDDWYNLVKGVGHYLGSANPGEDANMVLTAHNDIYGEIFRDIQYLEPGDEIRVQANNGRWHTYVVFDKQVVAPTDVWVLEPGSTPVVTLITCHPYRVDTQRMIVFGKLVSSGR
ncbi:MAG: sortase [Anaerolineae bacterium]|nr:sortase [Anaerolineae bacterium]